MVRAYERDGGEVAGDGRYREARYLACLVRICAGPAVDRYFVETVATLESVERTPLALTARTR